MIEELYHEAIKHNHYSLKLLIEYLVNERKILKMTDSEEKLTYYLQDRFANKMNEYLKEYEERRNGNSGAD
jgi:hypothetical protein